MRVRIRSARGRPPNRRCSAECVPAFRSISRAIDDWLEAMEPIQRAASKSTPAVADRLVDDPVDQASLLDFADEAMAFNRSLRR